MNESGEGGSGRPERGDTGPAERPGKTGTGGGPDRRARPSAPDPEPGSGRDDGDGWLLFVRDVVSSVVAVMFVGFFLFAVSGIWPPLVAVESGSMVPNMERNDLVFVMEEGRFPGEGAHHGVVTARTGERTGYTKFGNPGDVVVYAPGGSDGQTPIIHRAMFWVEEGENWCAAGDPAYLGSLEPEDEQCVAEHSGFITKGDNNGNYDQATGLSHPSPGRSPPVKPEWVVGTAELRLPGLGWIRLQSSG